MENCTHHFAREIENGPIVCRNCGAVPADPTPLTVNVQNTSSTTSNVLQGCGCIVIGFIIISVLIIII
jgi:hypothetical protein